jgi:DNA-binding CsgD family transcriptional regulator
MRVITRATVLEGLVETDTAREACVADLARRLASLTALDRAKDAALDRLDDGVALVDHRGRVLFANGIATSIIARGDGLILAGCGLRAATAADARRLEGLIADVAEGGTGGMMRVARPSLAEPFLLVVAPARPDGPWPVQLGPAAIIFIADPERTPRLQHRQLADLFGLTATEAKVAVAIASGKTGPQSARELRMSANTVHTHLRRIFHKLGVHRQADLTRVLMRAGIANCL